jgi:nucleoside-diphosphate-sugar epimerase
MKNDILVAGAIGRTGQIIVQKLLGRGLEPRVLVRDPEEAKKRFGGNVPYHTGDVREIETLRPAMRGVAVVISAVGAHIPVGKNCPRRVDYEGVANQVHAAKISGVGHFILISSIAVTQPEHPLNQFGNILKWKWQGEQALRKSGLSYTIIRPGCLKELGGQRHQLSFHQGDQFLGTISREDLAETCLQALQYTRGWNVTFEVIENGCGRPSDWQGLFSTLSPDEISGRIGHDLGF